jgi:hypothetical protein
VAEVADQVVDLLQKGPLNGRRRGCELLDGTLRELNVHPVFFSFTCLELAFHFFRNAPNSAPF